jgi:hypothetical protein
VSFVRTDRRECLQIGVIYVPKGGMSMQQIFDNEKGSQDYFDFLSSLGWAVRTVSPPCAHKLIGCSNEFLSFPILQVDLNTHTGFTGGLDPKATGTRTDSI